MFKKPEPLPSLRRHSGVTLMECAAVGPNRCEQAEFGDPSKQSLRSPCGSLMNLFEFDPKVSATAVAALGTVIGALAQLRMAWRKELSERARGVPTTKKSRRGPVLAVFLLLVAATVVGFVLSQYLMVRQSDRESAALRGDLQAQVARITATAERLERVTISDHIATANGDPRGVDEASVTTTVGPCRAVPAAADGVAPVCSEQEALRVTLCSSVPSSAVVTATVLYARPENSPQTWARSRVAPGEDIGRARFAEKIFERSESLQTKQICTAFSAWDAEQAYSARLVVTFGASTVAREVSNSVVAPIAEAENTNTAQ
jgi:hypothetical protein